MRLAPVMSMDFYQMVTVRPGDCVWLIAQRYLGDGDRYPEIAALNFGTQMTDGQVFTDPLLLRPGWVLQLPARYERAGTRDDPAVQHDQPGWHGGHRTSDCRFGSGHQAAEEPGLPGQATVRSGPAAGCAAGSVPPGRHHQRRVRSRNRRILVSAPLIAEPEPRLRAACDASMPSWRTLLADLGRQLIAAGELPVFTAVRLLPDGLELMLASPAEQPPPSPAVVVAGWLGTTWRIGLPSEPETGRAGPSDLLPGLVTVGEMDGGQLLVDLEYLQVTTVVGETGQVAALLRSAAAELAAGQLTGWYELILVGFEDFDLPGGRRARCDSVAEAIGRLASRASRITARLAECLDCDIRWHRLAEPQDEDWVLTLLVSSEPPSPWQLDELAELAAWPGGVAALVPGSPDAGRDAPACVELTSVGGQQLARVWPLQLEAQVAPLPEAGFEPLTGPDLATPAEPVAAKPGLQIGVLGSLTVNGQPGTLLPAQSQLLLALALRGSGGLSNQQLCHLLGVGPDHPKPSDSLRQLIVRTRRQLGLAADGREWIVHLGSGQYALHPEARFDWYEFDALASHGLAGRDTRALRGALELIRGQPFTGCYYWWLDPALTETVRAQIVAAADLLAELESGAGQHAAAARAAWIGLAGDAGAEQLWRALMRAEHAAGNLVGVREAWRRCLDAISEIATDGQPHEDTAALYYQLIGATGRQAAWARV